MWFGAAALASCIFVAGWTGKWRRILLQENKVCFDASDGYLAGIPVAEIGNRSHRKPDSDKSLQIRN